MQDRANSNRRREELKHVQEHTPHVISMVTTAHTERKTFREGWQVPWIQLEPVYVVWRRMSATSMYVIQRQLTTDNWRYILDMRQLTNPEMA
jgi:hypothetical protein